MLPIVSQRSPKDSDSSSLMSDISRTTGHSPNPLAMERRRGSLATNITGHKSDAVTGSKVPVIRTHHPHNASDCLGRDSGKSNSPM